MLFAEVLDGITHRIRLEHRYPILKTKRSLEHQRSLVRSNESTFQKPHLIEIGWRKRIGRIRWIGGDDGNAGVGALRAGLHGIRAHAGYLAIGGAAVHLVGRYQIDVVLLVSPDRAVLDRHRDHVVAVRRLLPALLVVLEEHADASGIRLDEVVVGHDGDSTGRYRIGVGLDGVAMCSTAAGHLLEQVQGVHAAVDGRVAVR